MKKIFALFLLASAVFAAAGAHAVEFTFRSPYPCTSFSPLQASGLALRKKQEMFNFSHGATLNVCQGRGDSLTCTGGSPEFDMRLGNMSYRITLDSMVAEAVYMDQWSGHVVVTLNMNMFANNSRLYCSRGNFSTMLIGNDVGMDNFETMACNLGQAFGHTPMHVVYRVDRVDSDAGLLGGWMCISGPDTRGMCLGQGDFRYVITRLPAPGCPSFANAYVNMPCLERFGEVCRLSSSGHMEHGHHQQQQHHHRAQRHHSSEFHHRPHHRR
ncbi:MAG: hypothetical protein FWF01_02265 [Alphaproteobacteria bacterium]|nr:hypothetical protein [Alphaproteobacteria bacterium]